MIKSIWNFISFRNCNKSKWKILTQRLCLFQVFNLFKLTFIQLFPERCIFNNLGFILCMYVCCCHFGFYTFRLGTARRDDSSQSIGWRRVNGYPIKGFMTIWWCVELGCSDKAYVCWTGILCHVFSCPVG